MAKAPTNQEFVSTRKAAARLRVSVSWINQLLHEGRPGKPRLDGHRNPDGTWRVSVNSIRRYERWRRARVYN